jgi:hypothetical protein
MLGVMRRKKARRGATPYMAPFLALLCLLGQLSSATHLLLVRHSTCPEHGELIDTTSRGSNSPAASASAATAAVTAAMPAVTAGPDLPAGHGHDHCAILSHQRQQIALHALQHSVDAPPPPLPVRVVVATRPVFAGTLYLLAPKNSPPA